MPSKAMRTIKASYGGRKAMSNTTNALERLSNSVSLGARRRIENGSAIIEDDGIGVRVICNPNGSGRAESMTSRCESMMCHSDRIDEMIAEAQAILSTFNAQALPRGGAQKGNEYAQD